MQITILGDGGLGRAVAQAAAGAGHMTRVLGRPASGLHSADVLALSDVVVEASCGDAVARNLRTALDAGCRRAVIATTGWSADRPDVEASFGKHGAAAVVAANFSIGVALFARLVDAAVDLLGPMPSFDPYVVEWHRRTKSDRPSATAGELARRILERHPAKRQIAGAHDGRGALELDVLEVASIRAGVSPGMHLVGFDSPGETVELRLTARDRSAYAAGILAASEWLMRAPRPAGLHPFEPIVDDLLAPRIAA